MNNSEIKNIIWDFNGTIIDDVEICYNIFVTEVENFNLPHLTLSTYRDIFSFPVKEFYINYGFPNSNSIFSGISERFAEQYVKTRYNASIHKGVHSLLRLANNNMVNQYVLSAYKDDELHIMLQKLGLSEYFTDILGIDNNSAGSKAEMGKILMNKHSIIPKNTALIGDTTHDYDVAKLLGVEPIIIANGHNSRYALEKYGIERIFDRIKDVELYLFS